MSTGPYLMFVRSRMAFSDHHDFTDWDFLGDDLHDRAWDEDAVLAWFPRRGQLANLKETPDWVDFIEIAAVSPEIGYSSLNHLPDDDDDDDDDDFDSTMSNLIWSEAPASIEQPFFDRRLLVVWYDDGAKDERIAEHNERIRRTLGRNNRPVWHSKGMFRFAFRDSKSCQDIANALNRVLIKGKVYDAGIFKVRGVAGVPGVPSPLGLFLSPHG